MRTLYLGAHPDDVEIGCAGTIAKRVGTDEQLVVVFSRCEKHSGLKFTGEKLSQELKLSMEVLKVDRYVQLEYENSRFPDFSHKIRATIEGLRSSFKPDTVYLSSLADQHQDHRILAQECVVAFRRGKEELRSYELGTTTPKFEPNMYVDIEETIETKIKALMCYESQFPRNQHRRELWIARAITRGVQVGIRYAEAFELLRSCE